MGKSSTGERDRSVLTLGPSDNYSWADRPDQSLYQGVQKERGDTQEKKGGAAEEKKGGQTSKRHICRRRGLRVGMLGEKAVDSIGNRYRVTAEGGKGKGDSEGGEKRGPEGLTSYHGAQAVPI